MRSLAVTIKRREHPPLRIECFSCPRKMQLWQARRAYRNSLSRFIGQICCEYCQGNAFSALNWHFYDEKNVKRHVRNRSTYDYMKDAQIITAFLEKLLSLLQWQIRITSKGIRI